MKRIHVFTGAKGSGKSTAAVTFVPPKEIAKLLAIDTEDSLSDLTHLGFEHVRMYERLAPAADMLDLLNQGKPPWVSKQQQSALVGYYDYFIRVLDEKLKKGKYKYLLLDTVGPIEASMMAAIENDRQVFGWSGTRAFGKFEVEAMRPLYDGLLEAVARRGIEHILITTHLKNPWVDGKPVMDKVKPSGRLKVFSMLSSAMYWLVPGSDPHGAPAALVLKARWGNTVPSDDGTHWVVQRILPQRIPVFNWNVINRYKANPPDLANPGEGERMSPEERDMISELLSEKSMELMILDRQVELKHQKASIIPVVESPGPSAALESVQDQAKRMLAEGKSRMEVVKATGLPIGSVVKLEKS